MIRRLLDLSQRELEEIAGKNKRGEVLIVIHPFWVKTNTAFEQFIREKGFEKQLTLVMEQHAEIPKLREKLAELGVKSSKRLFLVRTKTRLATPIMGWRKFLRRLSEMGIEEATVDGRHFGGVTRREFVFHKRLIEARRDLTQSERAHVLSYLRLQTKDARTSGGPLVKSQCGGNLCAKLNADKRFRARIRRRFA